MATETDVKYVENMICYDFGFRRDLLFRALTAAGAVEEDYDGNRALAQLGTGLCEFIFLYLGYEAQGSRDQTSDLRCSLSKVKQRAEVAKRTGINLCIRFNDRGGADSPGVLGKAVNAIIGAVFLDSKKSMTTVLRVMHRLSVFTPPEQSSVALSEQPASSLLDLNSLLESILELRDEETPSSTATRNLDLTNDSGSISPSREILVTGESSIAHSLAGEIGVEQSWRAQDNASVEESFDMDLNFDIFPPIEDHGASLEQDGQDQSDHDVDVDVQERHQPTKKRKVLSRSLPKEVKKPSAIRDDACEKFVSNEIEKCNATGCPPPGETFLTKATQKAVFEFGGKRAKTVLKILVHIASTQSVAGLQKLLKEMWDKKNDVPWYPQGPLSPEDRFSLISSLTNSISFQQLLRWHHILELFRQCGGPDTPACTGTVMITSHNFDPAPKMPGNPINKLLADVTKKMMAEALPNVLIGSAEYDNKLALMKSIRKFGERLNIFENEFGKGTLGLLSDHGITGQTDGGISESMITKFTDVEFRKLIEIINVSQGNTLRKYSDAVAPIVRVLATGETEQQPQLLNLRQIPQNDLLKHPKGSPELLTLISGMTAGALSPSDSESEMISEMRQDNSWDWYMID